MKQLFSEVVVFSNAKSLVKFTQDDFCHPDSFLMRFRICDLLYEIPFTDKTACVVVGDVPLRIDKVRYTLSENDCVFAVGEMTIKQSDDFGGVPLVPDGSVTTEKLADGAVTSEKIAPEAVCREQICQEILNEIASGSNEELERQLTEMQDDIDGLGSSIQNLGDAVDTANQNIQNLTQGLQQTDMALQSLGNDLEQEINRLNNAVSAATDFTDKVLEVKGINATGGDVTVAEFGEKTYATYAPPSTATTFTFTINGQPFTGVRFSVMTVPPSTTYWQNGGTLNPNFMFAGSPSTLNNILLYSGSSPNPANLIATVTIHPTDSTNARFSMTVMPTAGNTVTYTDNGVGVEQDYRKTTLLADALKTDDDGDERTLWFPAESGTLALTADVDAKLDKVDEPLYEGIPPVGVAYPDRVYAVAPNGTQKMLETRRSGMSPPFSPVSGGIVIANNDGTVSVSNPTNPFHAANKEYVDNAVFIGASAASGSTNLDTIGSYLTGLAGLSPLLSFPVLADPSLAVIVRYIYGAVKTMRFWRLQSLAADLTTPLGASPQVYWLTFKQANVAKSELQGANANQMSPNQIITRATELGQSETGVRGTSVQVVNGTYYLDVTLPMLTVSDVSDNTPVLVLVKFASGAVVSNGHAVELLGQ